MNKKEKQLFEDLKIKVAFRFTKPIEPDLDHPKLSSDEIVNGYSFNSYSKRIEKSCSSSVYHSSYGWDKTNQQQPIRQYSTKILALKAMRNEMENKAAKELYEIDKKIELLEVTNESS